MTDGGREYDTTALSVKSSADKIRLETQIKRGGGTRDEDRVKVKVKGDDADEVAARLAATLEALEEHGVAETLRATDPEASEADD